MNIPSLSVKNPVTTFMTFMAAIVIGVVCFMQLPVDLFPKMDIPVITVATSYGGASPSDVESKVTEILERSLGTVPELKHITSKSREGMSMIALQFEWETDLDARANDVRDSIAMAKIFLPDDVDEPRVFKLDIGRFPIIVFGVTAGESYPDIEKILEDRVADPLKRLPGVASVTVMSPLHRQVNINVDRERLASYGLSLQEVILAINRNNRDTPAGNIEAGLTDYPVRVPAECKDIKSLAALTLTSRNGGVVRLSDVAEVEDGFQELSQHVTINDGLGAMLMVQKQSSANSVDVARAVHKRLSELRPRLPSDIRILSIMDMSEDIERMITDLSGTLLEGGFLAMLVVLVFLREWRSTLVIGLTIPFSLILALIVDFFVGYTINMMSMFGMIIAVGRVIDDAIVVLENIARHREMGERPDEGSVYGASEVAMAITASTLTAVCIFLPIVFVKGLTGVFFREFAIVVTVTLLASLFSALTLTPMLSSTLMRGVSFGKGRRGRFFKASERVFNSVTNGYASLLGWALGHRRTVIIVSVCVFASSLAFLPFIGAEFMPEEDRAMIQGMAYLPVGARVSETQRALETINGIVKDVVPPDERTAVYTSCGKGGRGMEESMHPEQGSHIGEFGVKLVPRNKRQRSVAEIAAAMRAEIAAKQGFLNIERFSLSTGDPLQGLMMSNEKPLTINVTGNDVEESGRVAEQIKKIVAGTPGAVDVSTSIEQARSELWLKINRDRASSIALDAASIGDSVRAAFYGITASKYRVHGDEYDIVVKLREADRSAVPDLGRVPLRLFSGQLVRTENVADTSVMKGPVEISRRDQGRIVNVTANIGGRSLGEIVNDIRPKLARLQIPPGIEIVWGGQTEEMRDSFFWLGVAILLGAILVFMVMASQFESLVEPFVVMFSVPFAFTGTIWALVAGGHHVSIVALIGLLMLIGVVVSNAIVLVDYIGILRARGLSMNDALQEAGRARLRPVLMTSLTTIVALIPMAFGKGQGSEVWNPLGATFLGGMVVSTIVTLVLIPTLYSVFERFKRGVRTQ